MLFSYYSERFLRVGESLLLSGTFQQLSAGARCLYLCMAMESDSRREFVFFEKTAKEYGFDEETYNALVEELTTAAFIRNTGKTNCYKFSDDWKRKENTYENDV